MESTALIEQNGSDDAGSNRVNDEANRLLSAPGIKQFVDLAKPITAILEPLFIVDASQAKPDKVDSRLVQLQEELIGYAQTLFPDEGQRTEFLKKLNVERDAGMFGDTTKGAYKALVNHFEKALLPQIFSAHNNLGLALPAGLDFKVRGKDGSSPMSSAAFLESVQKGRGDLGIDVTTLDHHVKLVRVLTWTIEHRKKLEIVLVDRLEERLQQDFTSGLQEGHFPLTWARGTLDKRSWSDAFSQANSTYDSLSGLIDVAAKLEKKIPGFKSEFLHNPPPGLTIKRDSDGTIERVSFGPLLIDDLELSAERNKSKLDTIRAWYAKLHKEIGPVHLEAIKKTEDIPGYGKIPVKGFLNLDTKEFRLDEEPSSGNWKKFDLLRLDISVREERDGAGKLTKVTITPECKFRKIHPVLGYLNAYGETIYECSGKTVDYAPNDWVMVQLGPNQVEMKRARDVSGWLLRQELNQISSDAVSAGMDGALVVSGGLGLRAAFKAGHLASKGLIKAEAKDITAALTRSKLSSGFQIVLGATGIFTNAGASNLHPLVPFAMGVRADYFFVHAGYSVANALRLPAAAGAFVEAISPTSAKAIERIVTSIKGTEAVVKTLALARKAAFEKLGVTARTADVLARGTFWITEKAFVSMASHEIAFSHSNGLLTNDEKMRFKQLKPRDLSQFAQMFSQVSDGRVETANLKNYAALLGVQNADSMIKKTLELSRPEADKAERDRFRNELMDQVRYSRERVNSLQDKRKNSFAQFELESMAEAGQHLDPKMRLFAGLCMFMLAERNSDGSIPATLSQRDLRVGPFRQEIGSTEFGSVIYDTVAEYDIKQSVSVAEITELLERDLWNSPDQKTKIVKAKAMVDAGVFPANTLADMYLQFINGTEFGVNEDDRIKATTELINLVGRMKGAEALIGNPLGYCGLTAGLRAEDIVEKLHSTAMSMPDSRLKSTILFGLSGAKHIVSSDEVDLKRFADVFLSEKPGLTMPEFVAMLRADASVKIPPLAEDSRDNDVLARQWERKLYAGRLLLQFDPNSKQQKEDSAKIFVECATSRVPSVQVDAWQSFLQPSRGKQTLLETLEEEYPQKAWRSRVADICDKVMISLESGPREKLERLRAAWKLIEISTPFFTDLAERSRVKSFQQIGLESALHNHFSVLSRCLNPETNPLEIRAAAINAIGKFGYNSAQHVQTLLVHVNSRVEPSGVVRLAAAKALSGSPLTESDKGKLLGPLVATEPDPAVREVLCRFYQPGGTILDDGSDKSKQDRENITVSQERLMYDDRAVKAYLRERMPLLLSEKKTTILDFFDPSAVEVEVVTFFGQLPQKCTLQRAWQWCLQDQDRAGNLLRFEMVAQTEALKAYLAGTDVLRDLARSGNKTERTILTGQGDFRFTESEAAMCSLFMLLRGESQTTSPFYEHREGLEKGKAGTKHVPIAGAVAKERERLRSDNEYTIYMRERAGVKPPAVLQDIRTDPWPQVQKRLSNNILQLVKDGPDNLNFTLLVNNIFDTILPSTNVVNPSAIDDESGVTMVRALETILSRPGASPEVQRLVLEKLSDFVRTGAAIKNRPLTTLSLLNLVDRYSREILDPNGEALAKLRNGLRVRSGSDLVEPLVRLKANELYERSYNSVVHICNTRPYVQLTTQERLKHLPEPKEIAQIKRGYKPQPGESTDLKVREICERLFNASQAGPLPSNASKEWSKALSELLNDGIDDRVKLAACLASIFTRTGSDDDLKVTLRGLALNSEFASVRREALRAMKGSGIPDGALESHTRSLVETLSKTVEKPDTDYAQLNQKQLIEQTNRRLNELVASGDPRSKDLRKAIHRYGEALTVVVKQTDKSTGEGKILAREAIENSLTCFGVSKQDLDRLADRMHSYDSEIEGRKDEVDELVKRLTVSHSDTNQLPSLLVALDQYVGFNIGEMKTQLNPSNRAADGAEKGSVPSIKFRSTFMAIVLEKHLHQQYYSSGSVESVIGCTNLARSMQALADLKITSRELPRRFAQVEEALRLLELELSERRVFNQRYPNNWFGAKAERDLIVHQADYALNNVHQMLTSGCSPGDMQIKRMLEIAENRISEHPQADSSEAQFLRVKKLYVEMPLLTPDKRSEAIGTIVSNSFKYVQSVEHSQGVGSQSYERSLANMNVFLNRIAPEKAESFYKEKLKQLPQDDIEIRKIIIRQHASLLSSLKRQDEANLLLSQIKEP